MLIKDFGEFKLIERFRRAIATDSSVVVGSGDDCAVLKFDRENYQLFTCDMIVEGVDFTSKDPLELVGRKVLAISISDIAACGGVPRYAVVSLGLPKNMSVEKIDQLSRGLFALAKQYKINIVGGDLSRTDKIIIDVSMLGTVEKKNLCLRKGAEAGDIIFVTGPLGGSIKGKHLRFTPRLKEARSLIRQVKVNSMIDISDGLVQDLSHILDASIAGAALYENFIPVSKVASGLNDALFSGEDFELLFTLSRKEAKKLCKRPAYSFFPIGEIMPKNYGLKLIDKKGREKTLQIKGYCHFS